MVWTLTHEGVIKERHTYGWGFVLGGLCTGVLTVISTEAILMKYKKQNCQRLTDTEWSWRCEQFSYEPCCVRRTQALNRDTHAYALDFLQLASIEARDVCRWFL